MAKVFLVNQSFCLQNICETNYRKILCLIPDIKNIDRLAQGISNGKPKLHLQVIEQTSYTKTIQLSHFFECQSGIFLEPDVKIRLYFDVQIAEVLRDYKRIEVADAINDIGKSKEIMEYKWKLNFFLEKWLDHCLQKKYIFK